MKGMKLVLGIVLALPLTIGGVAFAQESTGSSQPTTSPVSSQSRENRIKARKDTSKRRLTQFEQGVVRSKCQAVHASVKATQSRVDSLEANRRQVYSRLVERLQKFSVKLKLAGVDATTYDQQVATLKTKADAFSTELVTLRQAIDDLGAMDCTADPEGFAVTLLEAKALRTSVIDKGKDFRAYLRDVLRPTFTNIRTELQLQSNRAKKES